MPLPINLKLLASSPVGDISKSGSITSKGAKGMMFFFGIYKILKLTIDILELQMKS